MAIVALGVVYGDIGTSPLYTMQTFLNGQGGLAHTDRAAVLGILSLSAALTNWLMAPLNIVERLLLVIAAVATWGVVGLAMSALATVPVIYVVLLLLTVGK